MTHETGLLLADRVTRLRQRLEQWQLDAVFITGEANRRWLSGFSGSLGYLLVSQDRALLAVDFRYWEQAEEEAPHFELFRLERREDDIPRFVSQLAPGQIGLEAHHTTVIGYRQLRRVPEVKWLSLDETVEPMRQVKDASELARIRAAAAITDHAMSRVPKLARPGMTESELAWELEKTIREGGAEAVAFPLIVASGPNSALPHHRPGSRRLAAGDPIIVDMGARVNSYCSDLTRTFFLGASADGRFNEVYALVQQAQAAALRSARGGMATDSIDALAREPIATAGFDEQFGHGLGHGVGLEIHEKPRISRTGAPTTVLPGTVATIEPGIYLPGWGGVRLEDLVLFHEDGVEVLSQAPMNPLIAA